jgi:cobalt-zinc-cadmium efflux system protein
MSEPFQPADCMHRAPPAAARRLRVVLILTGVFMVVEAVGGWISGSLALLADAGHMATDVAALGLALVTAAIGARPADDRKTYGYRRWEILAALANGAALIGVAVWVVVEAIHRFGDPPPVRVGLLLGIAGAGLLVNVVALSVLHGSHHHSLNTRGAYLHVLGDLLGSLAAIAAGVIIATTGWTLADPILSVGVALLILIGAWRLVAESVDILLEAVPRGISMAEVQRRMLAIAGVTAVHDLHVWTVGSGTVAMSGHAVVPDLALHPPALAAIRTAMGELGIGHVTIQLELDGGCDPVHVHAAGPGQGHAHDHGPGGHRH